MYIPYISTLLCTSINGGPPRHHTRNLNPTCQVKKAGRRRATHHKREFTEWRWADIVEPLVLVLEENVIQAKPVAGSTSMVIRAIRLRFERPWTILVVIDSWLAFGNETETDGADNGSMASAQRCCTSTTDEFEHTMYEAALGTRHECRPALFVSNQLSSAAVL